MRRITFFRFLGVSLLSAVALSAVFFFCLRFLSESSVYSHRQAFAIALAGEFEDRPFTEAVQNYGMRHQGPRGIRNQVWIVDASGKQIASSSTDPMPESWQDLPKPEAPHDFSVKFPLFGLAPELTVIRLQTTPPAYLVVRMGMRRQPARLFLLPLLLTFALVATAVFLALSFTSFYLQRKSKEAKEVLARLEKGDLKARFKIQRFDEVGNLMLDFNRMVSEIERLIHRVVETETARRNLLQELSHDLRTPLTGLRTSIETLRSHFETMSKEDRAEFFTIVDGELQYFVQLVEDLFFIADLAEPKYKATTSQLDLVEILSSEVKSRQITLGKIECRFDLLPSLDKALVLGDPHLIMRLFKNALDNAAKYAVRSIEVRIFDRHREWEIQIEDDGPGITAEEIQNFGKRRAHRIQARTGNHFSLGLGSVIMTAIAQMHDGRIEVESASSLLIENAAPKSGTRIKVFLPKRKS